MKRNNLLFITTLCSISLLHSATHLDLTNFKKALQQNNTSEMVRLYRMLKADTSANGQSRAQTAKAEAQYRGVDIEALVTASSAPRRRPAAPATTATTSPSTTATMPATTTTPAAPSATAAVTPPAIIPTTPTMGAAPTTPPSAPPLPTSGPRPVIYQRPSDAGTTPPIAPPLAPGASFAPSASSGVSGSPVKLKPIPSTMGDDFTTPNAPAIGYADSTRNAIGRIGNAIDYAKKIGRKYPTGSRNADFQDAIGGLDDAEKTLNSISLVLTKEDNTKLRAELSDAKKLLGSSAKYQTTGDQLATDLPALQKAIKDGFYQAQPGTFGAANTKAALAKYEDAMELYNKVHFNIKDEQQKQLQESINNLKALIDIQSAIDVANASWKDRNAHDARLNYTKALNLLQSTGSGLDAPIQDQLNKQLNKIKADSRIGIDSTTSTTPPPVPAKPISTSSDTYDSLTRELKDAPVVIPTELKTRAEAFLNANRSALTPEQVKRFEGHLGE